MAKSESSGKKSAGEAKPSARKSRAAEDGAGATAETGATAKKSTRKTAAADTTGAAAKKGARKSAGGGGGTGGAAKKATRKAAGSGGGGGGGGGEAGGGQAGAGGGGHDIRSHLRSFAAARPGGWGHDDWLGLLDELRGHGHDVSDTETVGRSLEEERLRHVLEASGVGAGQVDALVNRYGTVWSLRHADPDEVAGLVGGDRALAERIRGSLG